uniref:Uncharacterized protein n=1 Tax=viral metagenome TaxID=1070528 RepID=A0A6C0KYU0_9ZZZZ
MANEINNNAAEYQLIHEGQLKPPPPTRSSSSAIPTKSASVLNSDDFKIFQLELLWDIKKEKEFLDTVVGKLDWNIELSAEESRKLIDIYKSVYTKLCQNLFDIKYISQNTLKKLELGYDYQWGLDNTPLVPISTHYKLLFNEVNKLVSHSDTIKTHTTIKTKIDKFVDNKWDSSSLTISYGFGNILQELFPQNNEYVSKVLSYEKNVILAFNPLSGDAWMREKHFFSKTNNNTTNNANKRLKSIFNRVFKTGPPTKQNLLENVIYYEFKDNSGNDILFIFIDSIVSSALLLVYYDTMISKFSSKNLICSAWPICISDISPPYYTETFDNLITTTYMQPKNATTNNIPFKNSPYLARINKKNKTIKVKRTSWRPTYLPVQEILDKSSKIVGYPIINVNNIWSGFGGKSRRKSTVRVRARNTRKLNRRRRSKMQRGGATAQEALKAYAASLQMSEYDFFFFFANADYNKKQNPQFNTRGVSNPMVIDNYVFRLIGHRDYYLQARDKTAADTPEALKAMAIATDNIYIDKENADKYKTVMQISDR